MMSRVRTFDGIMLAAIAAVAVLGAGLKIGRYAGQRAPSQETVALRAEGVMAQHGWAPAPRPATDKSLPMIVLPFQRQGCGQGATIVVFANASGVEPHVRALAGRDALYIANSWLVATPGGNERTPIIAWLGSFAPITTAPAPRTGFAVAPDRNSSTPGCALPSPGDWRHSSPLANP